LLNDRRCGWDDGGGCFKLDTLGRAETIADCFIYLGNFFYFFWVARRVNIAHMRGDFTMKAGGKGFEEVPALFEGTESGLRDEILRDH
jgi:hypothetical protein